MKENLNMGKLVEVQDLQKYFPVRSGGIFRSQPTAWVKAVDGVDFDLKEGQTFSLVGESGCGKTTIMKLLLLLEKPTSGSIFLRGENISEFGRQELKYYRAAVQAVFQDPYGSLSPRLRTRAIIEEPLQALGTLSKAERKERIETVMSEVKLELEALHRYPHEFSGGQRQRIALARALSTKPRLILLDEPVSALDVSVRADIMNLLKDLQISLGLTYLLIAHNLATVRHMSHQMGVMYLGKLVEKARSEAFFDDPLHPYSQALIRATSLGGSVDTQVPIEGEVPSALNVPSGCRFHTRCRECMSVCRETEPEFRDVGDGHMVACHLY